MLHLPISGKIIAYADDTVLFFADATWEGVKIKAENGLHLVTNWLKHNLLTLNIEKTKFISFSLTTAGKSTLTKIKHHECGNIAFCSCKEYIESSEQIKYLGLHIDQFLKWNVHVDIVTGKLRKLLYKFYQLRQILKKPILINVYKSLIESVLNYGIVIWGGAYESTLKSLYTIQKFLIKIILNKPKTYPTEQLFHESKLFDLQGLYILSTLHFVHKHSNIGKLIDHKYQTRANINKNFNMSKPARQVFYKSMDYTGLRLFNILPQQIKQLRNKTKFKNKLKPYVLENIAAFKDIVNN